MSFILHMDSEQVYACAYQVRANNAEIRQHAQNLAVLGRSMEWYSPARDIFLAELERMVLAVTRLADEGDLLASRAQRTADEWLQLDEHFAGQFSQLIVPIIDKKG